MCQEILASAEIILTLPWSVDSLATYTKLMPSLSMLHKNIGDCIEKLFFILKNNANLHDTQLMQNDQNTRSNNTSASCS